MPYTERVGIMELAGKPATIIGDDIVVGQVAPEFVVQAADWSSVSGLASTAGKVRVFAALPSLSTSICDRETRTFNEQAASLGDSVRILVISADLPPTQKNWCAAAGVERVQTVSDHLDMDFGNKYATHMKERRWHRRAVFVVGPDDRVAYVQYLPSLGQEPDYTAVLEAVRALLPG